MKKHYVVCGYGRLGKQTVSELKSSDCDVAVVEADEAVAQGLVDQGVPVVVSDATDEDALRRAGVERAVGLLSALPDDADNVFVTLTARQMNPQIRIISRANTEKTSSKLYQAGAEQVVLPQEMGAKQMAYALIRPVVADFIDYVTGGNRDLQLDQWTVPADSSLVGQSVRDMQFRTRYGVSVLGIARRGKAVEIAGSLDQALEQGDTLVLLGPSENLSSLHR